MAQALPDIQVLYEDNHLIAVVKPFGMPSQNDETGDLSVAGWVEAYLREKYQKPGNVYVGLLHRLDRPVGGVMLVAKTSKAAARMSQVFAGHEAQKTYWAITERIPAQTTGTLRHFLAKLPGKNIVRAYHKPAYGAKEAILDYHLLRSQGSRALLEVLPKTGRQHQIRVQLASMGCVICGDVKYGKSEFLPNACIALYAKSLRVPHPVRKEETLEITAPTPTGFPWNLFPES